MNLDIVYYKNIPNMQQKDGEGKLNSNLLKGKIAEKGLTQSQLANKIGISVNSLSRKILGKREFVLAEVVNICEVLEIEDPRPIFFD